MLDDFNLEELDDFELQKASYEAWAYGYDKAKLTDFSIFLGIFYDPDLAVTCTSKITKEEIISVKAVPNNIDHFSVEVETVVKDETDESEYVGTIYRRIISNTPTAELLRLSYSDYTLTETGNLKILGDKINKFNINNLINIVVDLDSSPILVKVINKTSEFIICEFVD